MTFDAKKFREQADLELSTRNGGSLINESIKIPQNHISVFIGLGGLGCKAVNAIKGTAERKLDNSDNRFYLVIDTATNDLNDISVATISDLHATDAEKKDSKAKHGWMTESEKCPLFTAAHPYKVATLPHDIDDWADRRAMDGETISGVGAHAIRQLGRIMLFSGNNYRTVYNKIETILKRAIEQKATLPANHQNDAIKVYIVAGISGGTGSGTVVDVSYMVRKAMLDYGMESFSVEGVVFTPDVQENDLGMEPADKIKLKRNFYAAMKEIDYFYNNKARGKAYQCPIKDDNSSAYSYDIFDNCTIISRFANGHVMAPDSNGIISKTANAIVYEISSVQAADTNTANAQQQSLSSYMDNQSTRVSDWMQTAVGVGMQIPDWAPPLYSTLGYGSFYIPRDELLAYCANQLVGKLMDQWNENIFDAKKTQSFMRKYGIDSLRSFGAKIFDLGGCTESFKVSKQYLPRDRKGFKVENCISYLTEMDQTARSEGQEMNAKQIIRDVAMKTDGAIVQPLINYFDKAFLNQLPKTGPAHAVRLLSSIDVSNPGILKNLETMLSQVADVAKIWESDLTTVYNNLYRMGETYEGMGSIDKDELENYTASCRDYGEQLLQARLLRYSHDLLYNIYSQLNRKNNELFNIYTVTLKYLVDMLKKDSAYVVNPKRCREGNSTIFSFDMANFDEGDLMTAKFRRLFDGLVDNMDIQQKATEFINTVFIQIKEKLAVDNDFSEKTVLNVIREYFRKTFPLWTDDVIERFCIIAYSNLNLKPDDLTKIWNDPTKTDVMNTALSATADTITLKLKQEASSLLTLFDQTKNVEEFSGYTAMLGTNSTPKINNFISGCTAVHSSWSEFVLFKRRGGIPLCMINGLEEWQKIYKESANPGMHLDEVDDNWKLNLPEPYSYNIRKLSNKYVNDNMDQTEYDKKRMEDILSLAKKAKSLGLLHEKAQQQTNGNQDQNVVINYYQLIYEFVQPLNLQKDKELIFKKLKDCLEKALNLGLEPDMLRDINAAGYETAPPVEIRWTFTQSQFAGMMKDSVSFGDNNIFGNFITLIRSNYDWYVKLKNAVEEFTDLHVVYMAAYDEINAEKQFNNNLTLMLDAIMVNRFVPFYNNGMIAGFEIKTTDDPTQNIRFINEGFKKADNYFILYLAYTEKFLKLESVAVDSLKTLIKLDLNSENSKQLCRASRENVDWFISEAKRVIEDKTLLAHYSESLRNENIKGLIKYSQFDYSLPKSSNKNENIDAVISNLNFFYRELYKLLEENRIPDNVSYLGEAPKVESAHSTVQPQANVVPSQPQNGWICDCGTTNDADFNFCKKCGSKKPVEPEGWICPICGRMNSDDVNFCPKDGTPKPEKTGTTVIESWFCPKCGTKNEGDFCTKDGTPKPQ